MANMVEEIYAIAISRDEKRLRGLPEGWQTGNDLIIVAMRLMEGCCEPGWGGICWLISQRIDPDRIVCGVVLSSELLVNVISILKYARACGQVSIDKVVALASDYGKDLEFCRELKISLEKYFLDLDDLTAQWSEFNQAVAENRASLEPVNVYVIQKTLMLRLFSHIFIVLEQRVGEKTYYSMIDVNDVKLTEVDWYASYQPCSRGFFVEELQKIIGALKKNEECVDTCWNLSHISFSVQGNILNMKNDWEEYRKTHPYQMVMHNCADATEWFLEKYINIPKSRACAAPVSCNPVVLCCWLPSFFQCCTLPDRVMDHVKYTQEQFSEQNALNSPEPNLMK